MWPDGAGCDAARHRAAESPSAQLCSRFKGCLEVATETAKQHGGTCGSPQRKLRLERMAGMDSSRVQRKLSRVG